MDSTGLYEAFRSDVVDEVRPYLWTDDEVWRYANDAYHMFVRLTGGIPDFLSDATAIPIVTGEAVAALHPSILRIMSASRRSDLNTVNVINEADVGKLRSMDYGQVKRLLLDNNQGEVRYMVVGMQKNTVRWVQVPKVDDYVDMYVYRLPLSTITGDGQKLDDVEEIHHIHLLDWMKYLAYKKQDAETFNPQASAAGKQNFEAYCSLAKAEFDRMKHKTRVVSYGGL
jgi:hypothetical protein